MAVPHGTRRALDPITVDASLAVLWKASILFVYVSVRAYRVSGSIVMRNRSTFLVAGLLVVAAVIYLIVSSTGTTAQYFVTVAELQAMGEEALGRNITVSGAVLGETIVYDAMAPQVTFTIVAVPADPAEVEAAGGLAQVLHDATLDPTRPRLDVVYESVKPDLLTNEAQAIVRGTLGEDGRFEADELLLKCPSRYEDEVPAQVEN